MTNTAENQGTSGRKRAAMAAFVLAMTSASLLATAAPASADHVECKTNYTFVPTELWAQDGEDWWPDNVDEVQIDYPGQKYSTSIAFGDKRYEGQMPASTFSLWPGESFAVTMYEWDGSSPRNLGTRYISGSPHSFEVHFLPGMDYSYFLKYRVEAGNQTSECREYVYVPNVVGLDVAEAVGILDDNFKVATYYVENCTEPPDTVVDQDPTGGELPRWETVEIRATWCSRELN